MTAPRALLSVSDKTGLVDFARGLVSRGWEILSTGGTAASLRASGLPVVDVSEITGHPEIMDGRVKTLHPAVHGPILARPGHEEDAAALASLGYGRIDLVAVNLYPFRETVARGAVGIDEAMSKVDIGGPTMIRAAAKNHRAVWVVSDPADYERVLAALDGGAEVGPLRRELAAKVFRLMSGYDGAIADWLEREGAGTGEGLLPARLEISLTRVQALRYGENPDQAAAFYASGGAVQGLAALTQLHGKELSYNNLLDVDGALQALAPYAHAPQAAVAIIKHTTPCGIAVGDDAATAFRAALRTDPVSAFGSVIAVSRTVERGLAEALGDLFVECLVAPAFSREALEILGARKNLRLLSFPGGSGFLAEWGRRPEPRMLRSVYGGVLAQEPMEPPFAHAGDPDWKVVTARVPSAEEWDDLRFAWAAVSSVKSNAIVLARDGATIGIGAGQMSRVDSSRLAVTKAADAGLETAGAVLASDAFFPFRDGVEAAAAAGIRAIVQPGGSVRDPEVIEAADAHGIAMVFTGRRLFRH